MITKNVSKEQKGNDANRVLATVLDVIKEIPQQGQVQYDLQRQLRELRVAANKLGLYDAADFLRPHCG
jgi:hypothetical protein